MSEQRTLLEQASLLLARAAALPLTVMDNEELALVLCVTEATGRLLDGLRVTVSAEVADRCRFGLGTEAMCRPFGYTKASYFLEYATRISAAEASRRILLGSAVVPRVSMPGAILPPAEPLIADAVVSGDIGTEVAAHLHRLVRKVSRCTSREKLDEVLTELIEQAKVISCDLVAVQVREWIAILDVDGTEPREEAQRRRRAFHLGRESKGMTPFNGLLDPLSAGLVKAIFTEATQSSKHRFMTDEDRAAGTVTTDNEDRSTTTVEDDPRSRPQRQLDIICGTLKAGLRASAEQSGGMRSTVSVSIITYLADLQKQYDRENTGVGDGAGFGLAAMRPTAGRPTAGAGWIDGVAEPISTATIRQILCDGDYQKILLGNAGEVLYLERTHRLFSAAQRKALAVRDGGCAWPNCTVPAMQCDAHHVDEYGKGGPTHIDNALLLCGAHHGHLHTSDFTVKMFGGKPFIRQPFWLDPSKTWKPMGHTRGHISALSTAKATLAAFNSTAADLADLAMRARADDTEVDGDGLEDGGITYADDIPLWYTEPDPPSHAEVSKPVGNPDDPSNPGGSFTDLGMASKPSAPRSSLSESIRSYTVTERKRRPAKPTSPAVIPARDATVPINAETLPTTTAHPPMHARRHRSFRLETLAHTRTSPRRCPIHHSSTGGATTPPSRPQRI